MTQCKPPSSSSSLLSLAAAGAAAHAPKVISEKVDDSQSSEKRAARCSWIIHVSNAEKRMEVATPPSRRPTSSTSKLLKCFVAADKPYSTANSTQFSLRPYLSASPPTMVPNSMEEPKPTMNSWPICPLEKP